MNSRRQRYFRAGSPSGREMEVLDQGELVLEGDPGEDHPVSHEEIVDDGNEINQEHPMHQHSGQQIHYDERQINQYTVPPAPPRRPGRPGASTRYPQQMPIDVIQKLQSKNVYMSRQPGQMGSSHPTTRISPGGARIISLPYGTRKREMNDNGAGMVAKRIAPSQQIQQQQNQYGVRGGSQIHQQQSQQHQQQQQQQQQQQTQQGKDNRGVKVVRLIANAKVNPQVAEQSLVEIEERIKQTISESKVDMEKIKELQEQEMSPDEYAQTLEQLIGELNRLNASNVNLIDYYRSRQRNERVVYENREDVYLARIRQLEVENRKMREALYMMYQARIENFDSNMIRHEQVEQHDAHIGHIIEENERVILEEHDQHKQEDVPEWIVEETVDDAMHIHDQIEETEQPHQNEQNSLNKEKNDGDGHEQYVSSEQ